jgi:hypothetical protein
MAGNSNWQLYLYAGNQDVQSTAYDTAFITAIATPTAATVAILAPQEDAEFSFFTLEDVGGGVASTPRRRTKWDVESYPFYYKASAGQQSVDDLMTLADNLNNKKYLWARIVAGNRETPATGLVHPVYIEDWSTSVNKESGTRTLNITLKHRFNY